MGMPRSEGRADIPEPGSGPSPEPANVTLARAARDSSASGSDGGEPRPLPDILLHVFGGDAYADLRIRLRRL